MTEISNLQLNRLTAAQGLSFSLPRSNQDVVFVDVGDRKIESNIVRDGVPIVAHEIDSEVLDRFVIGEPIIAYRIVGQTVPAGTPVPMDTAVDVVMAQPETLPVGVIKGVHTALAQQSVSTAFANLVQGRPEAVRLASRATQGPLSAADEQSLAVLFEQAGAPITTTPGEDFSAAITTLQMLTTFGGQ